MRYKGGFVKRMERMSQYWQERKGPVLQLLQMLNFLIAAAMTVIVVWVVPISVTGTGFVLSFVAHPYVYPLVIYGSLLIIGRVFIFFIFADIKKFEISQFGSVEFQSESQKLESGSHREFLNQMFKKELEFLLTLEKTETYDTYDIAKALTVPLLEANKEIMLKEGTIIQVKNTDELTTFERQLATQAETGRVVVHNGIKQAVLLGNINDEVFLVIEKETSFTDEYAGTIENIVNYIPRLREILIDNL